MEQQEKVKMRDYVFPLNKMIIIKNEYNARRGLGKATTGIAKVRRNEQPKCHLEVCSTLCPYCDKKFVADIVGMDKDHDAVTLARIDKGGRTDADWCSCMVMYLKGKCHFDEVDGREWKFAKKHSPRLMKDCPLRVEHEMYGWNKEQNRE